MIGIACLIALQVISCAGGSLRALVSPQAGSDAAITGQYLNNEFGYVTTVPKSVAAHPASGPAAKHGFVIDLHVNPRAYLWVDGSRNDQGWKSFDDAVNARIDDIKEAGGTHIVVLEKERTHLAGLRAFHFTLRYDTPDSRDPTLQEVIVAFRKTENGTDLVYTIGLVAASWLHARHHKLIEEIRKTWKLRPL
jgi:hypothetical protein